jgi:hypothetical protein
MFLRDKKMESYTVEYADIPPWEIIGGVIGATYWNWQYNDLMWVEQN